MNKTQRTGQQVVCHIKVAEVAKAAAGQLYEQVMGNNDLFMIWKKQNPGASPKVLEKRFIDKNWPQCIEFARNTLTVMLTKDDIAESLKDEIMIVLEQDFSLRRGTTNGTRYGAVK
jgi:hypothetical protein